MNTKVMGAAVAGTIPQVMAAAERLSLAQKSASNYASAGELSEDARDQICQALEGADLPIYTGVRASWTTQYKADRECTMEASEKAWERFCKEFAIEKPKSEKPAAKAMSEKRLADKAALDALSMSDLEKGKTLAVAKAKDCLNANDLQGSQAAQAEATKLNLALIARQKEDGKVVTDILSRKRKAIAEKLKTANLETLNRIEALLDGVSGNATPEQVAVAGNEIASAPLVAVAA